MNRKIFASVLVALAVLFPFLGTLVNSELVASFFALSAIFMSFLLSLQLYRESKGERKGVMSAICLSSALFFISTISYLLPLDFEEVETLPIAIASLPVLFYGISKLFRELRFLKPKHLAIPSAVFVFAILASLTFPISTAHVLFAIDSLILMAFLSLLILYINAETRIYWASILLAFTIIYFFNLVHSLKLEIAPLSYPSELFLGLFASAILFLLYDVWKRGTEVLSLEKIESEKRALEELLATIDEMREGLRLMNQTLRHDVLRKLQIISGYVEAYELTKNSEFLEKSLNAVKECAEFVEKIGLIEKALSVEESKLRPIKVGEIVRELAKKYEMRINVKGDAVAIADESLYFVIDVILDNAQRHSGTERVDVLISEIEDECEIRIVDYGVGIPEDVKKVLFKERIRSGDTSGLGLGLYIVKKFVDRYRGKVWVEDTKPKGATFVIRLRAATRTSEPQ